MATGKNTKQAEATRQQVLNQAQQQLAQQQLAQNPYRPGSLTKGTAAAIKAYQTAKANALGGGGEATGPEELGFTSPEEMGNVVRFGDTEDIRRQELQNALGGSKTFTRGEIRRGYRKL